MRTFAEVDALWFEMTNVGSILMLLSGSPILPTADFDAVLDLSGFPLIVSFTFSGGINCRKLYRATGSRPARSEDLSSPTPPLLISGPRLEGFEPHV